MTMDTILLGLLVYLAETAVLTLGTLRVMVSMLGERKVAFIFGVVEMLLWVAGTSTVIMKVADEPFLAVCYALGFGTGSALGITCEKKLALGNVVLRIISNSYGRKIAKAVREAGYGITTVTGDGDEGPVTVQFIVCKRKDMKHILTLARAVDPGLFYTFETAGASWVQGPEKMSLFHRLKGRRMRPTKKD